MSYMTNCKDTIKLLAVGLLIVAGLVVGGLYIPYFWGWFVLVLAFGVLKKHVTKP